MPFLTIPSLKNKPAVAIPNNHNNPTKKEFRIFLKYFFTSGSIPVLYSSTLIKVLIMS